MRNAMPVEHKDLGVGMYGYYDGTKVVVSDSLIGSNSYEAYREVLDTLFHEGRHAYQSYNLDIRQTDQSETLVDAWKVNLQELGYDSAASFYFLILFTLVNRKLGRCLGLVDNFKIIRNASVPDLLQRYPLWQEGRLPKDLRLQL